jgi:hypothetical protein
MEAQEAGIVENPVMEKEEESNSSSDSEADTED